MYNASGDDMRRQFAACFLACGTPGLSQAIASHHKDFPHSDEQLSHVDEEVSDLNEPFRIEHADHDESGHFDMEASSYYKNLSDSDF